MSDDSKIKSINDYCPDFLLKNLEINIFKSNFENSIYCASELDLFSFTNYDFDLSESIRTKLFNQLMIIYMKNVYNPRIWIDLNNLILELEQLRQLRKESDFINKYSINSCKIKTREMQIISSIVNTFCLSYKSLDNIYYKFCLYNFNKLTEEEKNGLKRKFFFFEDIDFSKYSEYISYSPTRQPEYMINIVGELKLLCKNFIGALEQKNDISIYFAHSIKNYKNSIPSFFNSFVNSSYLIFDLIEFVFKNEKSPYVEYIEIAKAWYQILPEKENYLCWQTLILFYIKNDVPHIPISYLDEDQSRQSYEKNVSFIKRDLKSTFSINDLDKIEELYSNKEYKNAFIYHKNNKNDRLYESYYSSNQEEVKKSSNQEDYAKFITKSSENSYIAEKNNNIIMVKGPYKNWDDVKRFKRIQEAKSIFGLKNINYEIIFLIPEKESKSYPFIVFNMNNIFEKGNFSIKKESVDWSNFNVKSEKDVDYINNKIFRYLFGIKDSKDNYIYKNGVYTINDDEIEDTNNTIDISFIKNNAELIKNFLLKLKLNKKLTSLIKNNKLVELISIMEKHKTSLVKTANTFMIVNEIIGKDPFILYTSNIFDKDYLEGIVKNQLIELSKQYPHLYSSIEEYEKLSTKKMKRTMTLDKGNKLYNLPDNIYENETYLLSSVLKDDQMPYLIYINAKNDNKMSSKYRNEKTWNGYDLDIMKSALQKYIRRGVLDKALYVAGELDLFKEDKDRGEVIRTNFLHRLMIIYLEDVENISIFPEVNKLAEDIFKERQKEDRNKSNEEKMISRLVYILCKSKKARVCSHIRAVFNPKYNNKKILSVYPSIKKMWNEIDQNKNSDKYDLFKKYLKDKNILCVYYGFQIDISEEKYGRKKAVWFIFEELKNLKIDNINEYISWYKNHIGKMKEGFLCWLFPLLIYLSVIKEYKDTIKEDNYIDNWDKNRKMEIIDIDDYVVDKHTKKGSSRDLVEFALIGAHVENEATSVNNLWKKFYEDGKRYEEGQPIIGETIEFDEKDEIDYPLETQEYSFIVLTQLTTSSSKMDVYFAKDKKGKFVVVKGPYQNKKQIDVLLKNTECKKKNNLPYINFKIRQMIPDRWPSGIPLGARNSIDRKSPAWFIIFDSIIEESKIKTKIHSSKLWPETSVVDWDKISDIHFEYKSGKRTDNEIKDYVHAILFRYIRGISDLADRNFLMTDKRIISIDEDIEGHPVKLSTELRKNKTEFLYNWINKHYDNLDIHKWEVCDKNDIERLEEIKNKKECLKLFKS